MSELARPVAIDRIGTTGLDISVVAASEELAPIAARLQLPGLAELRCVFRLKRLEDSVIAASGTLLAQLTQTCVVSLDEFSQTISESFEIRFVPAGSETEDDDPDAPDEIPYPEGAIDLGEAAIEQLALALDPYPRRPGLDPSDLAEPETPHPFAALAGLRRPQ